MHTGKIEPDLTYDMAETAALVFHRDVRWLYRNLPTLMDEADFPRPISPVGQRRWLGQVLLDWMGREQPVAVFPSIRAG